MTSQPLRQIFLFTISLCLIGISCSKDPLITPPEQYGLTHIYNRGNIVDLGVCNKYVLFLNGKNEMVLHSFTDSSFKHYNEVNSAINTSTIVGIQSLNDTTVVFGERTTGIRYFYNDKLHDHIRIGNLKKFNCQDQLTFVSNEPKILINNKIENSRQWYLPNDKIFTCTAGRNDTMYVGTEENGIFRNKPQKVVSLLLEDEDFKDIDSQFIGSCIQMIIDTRGILWTLTTRGLVQYNSKRKDFIPLPKNHIGKHMVIHNDTIYVLTNQGIYKLEYDKIVAYSPLQNVFDSDNINVFEIDSKGSFWIGTNKGLYKFRDKDMAF